MSAELDTLLWTHKREYIYILKLKNIGRIIFS